MLEDATPGTHVLWAVSYWQASATQASVAKEEEAASQQAQELRVQSAVLSQEFSRVFKRSQTGFIPSAILYISLFAFTSFLSTNRSISWWTNASAAQLGKAEAARTMKEECQADLDKAP